MSSQVENRGLTWWTSFGVFSIWNYLEECLVHNCDGVCTVVGEGVSEVVNVVWTLSVVLHASHVKFEESVFVDRLVELCEVRNDSLH